MLGWLDFSFKRSLGLEGTSLEEKNLGTEQICITMEALSKYAERTTILKEWFDG